MLHWAYYILLVVVEVCAAALNLFSLPGNWVMLVAVAVYGVLTRWEHFGLWWMVVLLVLALIAEGVEFLAAGAGAKQAGGTLYGAAGALVGGTVGAILLTGLIPVPIVGTLAGILIGTFGGAMLAEIIGGKELGQSAWVGYGAAKGRVLGTLSKLVFACAILIVSLYAALPLHARAAAVPATPPALPAPAIPSTARAALPTTPPAAPPATAPMTPPN